VRACPRSLKSDCAPTPRQTRKRMPAQHPQRNEISDNTFRAALCLCKVSFALVAISSCFRLRDSDKRACIDVASPAVDAASFRLRSKARTRLRNCEAVILSK